MNKKIISLITTAAIAASTGVVFADAPEVNVVVNGAKINFADQKAVIENDRTLIPARGAFEAMGAKVEWDGEARKVTVTNNRNTKIAVLAIDSDKMEVTTYTSLFDMTKEEVTLDVPAQIMNDRTMIPLRAVGEAMGATVGWDGETYTASITTIEGEKLEAEKDKQETEDKAENATEENADEAVVEEVKLASLSLSKVESETEDEVVVSVDLKGMALYPESYVAGVTVTVEYDSDVLEFKSAGLYNGDAKVENSMGADNPEYSDTALKVAHITIDDEAAAKADGSVMKITFKKLKDEATEVALLSGYNTKIGYETAIVLDGENNTEELEGTNLIIDETPLVIE